jgi:soluble lytic murein transglycosylase
MLAAPAAVAAGKDKAHPSPKVAAKGGPGGKSKAAVHRKAGVAQRSASHARAGKSKTSKSKSNRSARRPVSIKDVPFPRPRPGNQAAATGFASNAPAGSAQRAIGHIAAIPPLPPQPPITAPAYAAPVAPDAPPFTPARLAAPLAMSDGAATSAADLAIAKQALALIDKNKMEDATQVARGAQDPLVRKLVEWVILRDYNNHADFARYAAFIGANPSWPSVNMFRRRAEAILWQDRADPAVIKSFFAVTKPMTAKGELALARVLMGQGDTAGARKLVSDAWRTDALSSDAEKQVLDEFGGLLTRADHKARMDTRLYSEDFDAGTRAAARLGGAEAAIAKARIAVMKKARNAGALLDAVPQEARRDAGYIFNRIQYLRRADKLAEAAQLMLAAPRNPSEICDTDEWWVERRLLARKLLDIGDSKTAYLVARDAAPPAQDNYRVDHHFTAGWIALRFLNEPRTALSHFAQIARGTTNPTALARAAYWQGRAAEAAGRHAEAKRFYERGAAYHSTYYGQLARAKVGIGNMVLRTVPEIPPAASRLEIVRAVEILYALDQADLVVPIAAELPDRTIDGGALAAVAAVMEKNSDARSLLLLGKGALNRGLPFDVHAYPIVGLPRYQPIGPAVEPWVAYSIARQESGFNPRVVSPAKAMGLMQVTPPTGKYIAKKFNIAYDQKRLLGDPAYNVQLGAAELGDLIQDYGGSYIMSFAAYNAGRGRVRQWVERYGDPRDPDVDPIDWVERIPFSETRNYVQRILENMQVYRIRFGGPPRLMIEADLQRGHSLN